MSSPRLPLSSRPTFLPDEIARREFANVFRGYDPAEVRTFLNQLSEQASESSDRIAEFQKALAETEERVKNPELTEEMVTNLLGEQTAQILRSAREAASETRRKADEEVGRQLRDAHEVTSRMKEEAETLLRERTEEAERISENLRDEANKYADETRASANDDASAIRNEIAAEAERRRAELDAEILRKREQAEREINESHVRARQQARELIDLARVESQALVARTQDRQAELIEGLVRKRKIAIAQVDSLRAGRERLLGAYKMVRSTLDEVTSELQKVEAEARSAGVEAGQRSAAVSEIPPDAVDEVIEMESFELEDDVPSRIINLSADDASPETLEDEGEMVEAVEVHTQTEIIEAEIIEAEVLEIDANEEEQQARPFDFDAAATAGDSVKTEVVDIIAVETIVEEEIVETPGGGGASTMVREEQQTLNVVTETEETRAMTITNIGSAYAENDTTDTGRALKLRRDAVIGKARSQASRRLKRALQDEQDGVIARLRNNDNKSVQAILGSPDDQAAAYHRAVVKLLREVVRTGASSVAGSKGVERGIVDKTGTAAARSLAEVVVSDLRQQLVPVLEDMLNAPERPAVDILSLRVSTCYDSVKGHYLDRLIDERVGGVFDEGVSLAG